MIESAITELITYGIQKGFVELEDTILVRNRILEILQCDSYEVGAAGPSGKPHRLADILGDLVDHAVEHGVIEDSVESRDLFDTKIMGALTPLPSYVIRHFRELEAQSPQAATDWYYQFSQDTNYIRTDRIQRDMRWKTETEFGELDITINLSKPEKDPRDIARAGKVQSGAKYPACLLCYENEGYAGRFGHPARQNHRIIPIRLAEEPYFLQYSPYVYYNEHCIVLNKEHVPMRIDKAVFRKLLDFTAQFPHYMIGSNADLPIVGGSILSHDHFQGGNYEFPMMRAEYDREFSIPGFEDVEAGRIHWPLSTIRLKCSKVDRLAEAADHILQTWRNYSDPDAFIFAETDGESHNTITPIARRVDDRFVLDLVLRNNITTHEHPLGVYHPHAEYHHIKKENIGLIEVMGLAVLPSRLKKEMEDLAAALLGGAGPDELAADPLTAAHARWAGQLIAKYRAAGTEFSTENIDAILQREVGIVFSRVLECAGVYKCTPAGAAAFDRFIEVL